MIEGTYNVLISSVITSILTIYTILCFLNKKEFFYKNRTILSIFVYFIITVFLYNLTDNVVRVIFNMLVLNLCVYIILKSEFINIFISSMIYIIVLIFSEFIYVIIFLQFINYNLERFKDLYFASINGNIFIVIMTFLILNHSKATELLKKILIVNKFKQKKLVIFDFIVFCLMLILVLYYSYFNFSPFQNFLFSFLIIVFLTMILFQYINVQTNNYNLAFQYSISEEKLKDTQFILNKYRKANHENINQLIALKGMLNNHEDTENYINLLLDRNKVSGARQNNKDIKSKVNSIPFKDMQALIIYKNAEMEKNNILFNVNINFLQNDINDIEIFDLKTKQNICELLGIYIDNARDAVIDSLKKEILLDMYTDNEYLYVEISNFYYNKINYSNDNGIISSTKGENHGNGLLIANEIIKSNEKINSSIVINGNIYTQKLRIKYSNKNN